MIETDLKEINANLKTLVGLFTAVIKGEAPSRAEDTAPALVNSEAALTAAQPAPLAPEAAPVNAPESPVNTEEKAKKGPENTPKEVDKAPQNENTPAAEPGDAGAVRKAEQAAPSENSSEEMTNAQFQKEMNPWLGCAIDIANLGGPAVPSQIETLLKPLGASSFRGVKPAQRPEVIRLANEDLSERKAELARLLERVQAEAKKK